MRTLPKSCRSFINGHYAANSVHTQSVPNLYPGTNATINHVFYADESNIEEAVITSQHAFKIWSAMPINARSNILLEAARLLRERNDELAAVEVWDTGKPIAEASSVDICSAADALEYFAKAALALHDDVMPHPHALIYTRREPLGVCVGIGAWNYPLQIACWKAAPALIMGNTMIFKPSEHTPMTALILAEVFIQAGMPAGVFNVVLGDGAVAEKLLSHSGIAKISFTGSVPTGKKIALQAAAKLVPVTLELGGKSPLIIFDDANLDQAVIGCMLANFYTQGEICSNGTRVYIARSKHGEFLDKLCKRVRLLKMGDPFDRQTQVGALISRLHMKKVRDYIQQGKQEGATALVGGDSVTTLPLESGNFVAPTIFADCSDDMLIVREEIFGPVMCALIFDEEDEVIARANQSDYGLAAGVFTDHIKRAHRVISQLQAGTCWVNNYNATPVSMPFGGYKHSGIGRENALTTLHHYSQLKSIYVELNEIEHTY